MRCYIDNGDGTEDDHNKQDIDNLRVSGTRLRVDKNGEPNACNDDDEVSCQDEGDNDGNDGQQGEGDDRGQEGQDVQGRGSRAGR